jgi:hypothetical protein
MVHNNSAMRHMQNFPSSAKPLLEMGLNEKEWKGLGKSKREMWRNSMKHLDLFCIKYDKFGWGWDDEWVKVVVAGQWRKKGVREMQGGGRYWLSFLSLSYLGLNRKLRSSGRLRSNRRGRGKGLELVEGFVPICHLNPILTPIINSI